MSYRTVGLYNLWCLTGRMLVADLSSPHHHKLGEDSKMMVHWKLTLCISIKKNIVIHSLQTWQIPRTASVSSEEFSTITKSFQKLGDVHWMALIWRINKINLVQVYKPLFPYILDTKEWVGLLLSASSHVAQLSDSAWYNPTQPLQNSTKKPKPQLKQQHKHTNPSTFTKMNKMKFVLKYYILIW